MTAPITAATAITYPGPPPGEADCVIIGGGVIGVCTALFLARQGQNVVLVEKGRIAGEQSSRNWGWIRQQGRDPDELPIMVEANRHWQEFARETNVEIGLRQCGITYLARSEKELESYRTWLPHAQICGVDTQILTRAQTAALMPGTSRSYPGALYTASDMRAEPGLAVPALAGIAQRDGVQLVENCAARALDITNGQISGVLTEAGLIKTARAVMAGGAWSSLFLQAHGVRIPQLSVRASVCATHALPEIGQACTSDRGVTWRRRLDGGYTLTPSGFHELFIGRDAFRYLPKYITQLKSDPFGTRYYAAAPKGFPDAWRTPRRWRTDQESPFERMRVLDPEPNMKKLGQMAQRFGDLFPQLGPIRIANAWAGMIDTMPDLVPVVDRAPAIDGLIIGTGMSGHGFGIGPGMGRVLADLTQGKAPGYDLSRFRLSRFADGSAINLGPAL